MSKQPLYWRSHWEMRKIHRHSKVLLLWRWRSNGPWNSYKFQRIFDGIKNEPRWTPASHLCEETRISLFLSFWVDGIEREAQTETDCAGEIGSLSPIRSAGTQPIRWWRTFLSRNRSNGRRRSIYRTIWYGDWTRCGQTRSFTTRSFEQPAKFSSDGQCLSSTKQANRRGLGTRLG